jgi:hypothetical protein
MPDEAYAEHLDPGEGFRFAVGSEAGPHSTVHRIWTSKNSSDVYLTSVPVSGHQKVSLHESGEWKHSFLSEVAMKYVERNAERHIEQWTRPDPVVPGWVRAYSITIPRTELRYTTQDLSNVRWVPDPGHGYWVRVEVVLMDESGAGFEVAWDDAFMLGKLNLNNGGGVVIVGQRFRPEKGVAQKLAAYRDMFIADEAFEMMKDADFPVVALYGQQKDGARTLTELAMSPPPPEVRVICTSRPVHPPAHIDTRWRNPDLYIGGRMGEGAPSK